MNVKLPWKESTSLEDHYSNDSCRDWGAKFELVEKKTGNSVCSKDTIVIPPRPHVRYQRRNSATARMLLESLSSPITNSIIHETDSKEPTTRKSLHTVHTDELEELKERKIVTERSDKESSVTSQISLGKITTSSRMRKRGSLPWSQKYRDSIFESEKIEDTRAGKRQKKE
jgi:hypothetical protein